MIDRQVDTMLNMIVTLAFNPVLSPFLKATETRCSPLHRWICIDAVSSRHVVHVPGSQYHPS